MSVFRLKKWNAAPLLCIIKIHYCSESTTVDCLHSKLVFNQLSVNRNILLSRFFFFRKHLYLYNQLRLLRTIFIAFGVRSNRSWLYCLEVCFSSLASEDVMCLPALEKMVCPVFFIPLSYKATDTSMFVSTNVILDHNCNLYYENIRCLNRFFLFRFVFFRLVPGTLCQLFS